MVEINESIASCASSWLNSPFSNWVIIFEILTDESTICCLSLNLTASSAGAATLVSKRSTTLMGGKESFSMEFKPTA